MFNQTSWDNRSTRINLTSNSSVLDFTNANADYRVGALSGVAGSQVKLGNLPTTATGPAAGRTLVVGDTNNTSIFAGTISDTGAVATAASSGKFQKEGEGNFYLNGVNTYRGTTVVNNGGLFVNGAIGVDPTTGVGIVTAFNTLSLNNAFLGGEGTINANVTSTGLGYISAGRYLGTDYGYSDDGIVGTLNIKGSFTQSSSNATIIVDIASPTKYDKIIVGGNIAIDGKLSVQPKPGQPLLPGQYRVLQSISGVRTGQFKYVLFPASLTLKLQGNDAVYGPNFVDLVLVQYPFSSIGELSPNGKKVAAQLDNFLTAPEAQVMIGTLNAIGGVTSMDRALGQVAPLADRYWLPFAVSTASDIVSSIEDRILQPLADTEHKWSLFAGASSMSNHLNAQDDAETTLGTVNRGFVGIDRHIGSHFSAGLFYSNESTSVSADRLGGRGKVKGNTFGAYGEFHEGAWSASGVAFTGSDKYTSHRSVMLAGLGDFADGSTTGDRLGVSGDANRAFDVGFGSVAPYVGIQFLSWKAKGLTETGTNLPLTIASQNADSLVVKGGLRWLYTFDLYSLRFRSFANLGYQSEVGDSTHEIGTTLNGTGYSVRTNHDGIGYILRAGFEADLLRNLTLSFSAGRNSGLHDLDMVSYSGGVTYRF